jgi:phosphorylcholine metabolism protein LicD
LNNVLSENNVPERGLTKKKALDAIERCIVISSWADYKNMEFEGKFFKIPKWTDLM